MWSLKPLKNGGKYKIIWVVLEKATKSGSNILLIYRKIDEDMHTYKGFLRKFRGLYEAKKRERERRV